MAALLEATLLLVAVLVLTGTRAAARGVGLDDGLGDGEEPTDGPAVTPLCPRRCECPVDTKVVNCSSRRLTSFPDLSEVPEDVVVLDLSDNLIKAVPRSLPAWDRLEVLTLAGNQLADFPPFALGDMPALEMLDLSRNKITSLRFIKPDRFIANNPVLQVLNLSGNAIQDLGHGSFTSLSSTSLSVLDVSHCAVSSINGEEALREVPSLSVLRVAGNPLHMLPALQAPSLRELDASGCRLRTVTARVLSALPQLTHLVVSHNPELATFQPPGAATPSPEEPLAHLVNGTPPWSLSLQVLEAEGCSLHDLLFLETLPNLTEVRLRGNRISWLESRLDSGRLQHLDLADNQLESLPADLFKGADLLRELDLSGNRLTVLHPNTFSLLAALRKLNVSRNPLASLQLSAPSLRVLDASHAGVQVLPEGVLDELPQLRHLNLSNNPLPQLPDRLASAGRDAALHSLDVSFCRLADLQVTTLDGLPLLQTLDLRGNRFTDPLKVAAFSENPVLHHLRLGDNPWRCDCWSKGYRAFVKYIQTHPVKEDTTALACHSPEAAQGESWHDACLAAGNKSLASMDTWMFVVILGLSVVLVSVGVLAVRRYTRGKGRRRRQQEEEEEEERRHEEARQQLQQELRRQHIRRIQPATMDDPDDEGDDTADYSYHPPSYEEAVLMDRMTQEDPPEEDSDSDEDADDALQRELHNKIARVHSGRHSPLIEEEEDDEAASPRQSNGVLRNNTKL